MPSREEILAFIKKNPSKANKRDVARHFKITGAARIELKRILKDLMADGLVEKRQKQMLLPGELPPVFVATIRAASSEGELLAEPQNWDDALGTPPKVLILPEKRNKSQGVPALAIGDRVLLRLADVDPGAEAQFCARPIKKLQRQQDEVLGVLSIDPLSKEAILSPVDRKQRELNVDPRYLEGAKDSDLVAVEVVKAGRMRYPQARVTKVIGSMKSEKAVSEIALYTQNIPTEFPEAALAQAEAAAPVSQGKREDWRHLPLLTIDPADAKDHDDAVYAEADTAEDNPGGHIIYVAIADVAAYVTPGSPLDKEALKRGNSVYFPDRVIPMLPERISNNLCSLRELEDRPSMAVRMIFTAEGQKLSHSFHRVIMRSAAKLSYQQAQKAIDGVVDDKTGPLLEPVLKPLWQAYDALKRGRDKRAPLELDLPERKIKLKDDGTVDSVFVPERLDAHKLIEEFMIQANVAAAEQLEAKRAPVLYRVHDASTPEKLASLRDFLSTMSIKLPTIGGLRPSVFNHILAKVAETPSAQLVNEVVLRSQAQAEYTPQNIGHFGLNLRRYAHFTSPIRRYADLLIHRSLIRSLGLGKDGLPDGFEDKLDVIGGEISAAERRAMLAERETIDRLIALWLCDKLGATFKGRIAGVTKAGLFVRLSESGADGFVPASTIGTDFYEYVETAHALTAVHSGETFQLGDSVEVRLVEAAPFAGSLRFELLSKGQIRKDVHAHLRGNRKPERRRRPSKPHGLKRTKPKRR
ncbi:ribonuclease R [Polycladidibacter hongkongensis]|uniref:ribonuclease R n=1 Tax=Polycladidibacter hongkongensis TaxID=1647556 RepID=UPI0008346495|nr:ribonuclease R [Pseudovibrio hongkongensis]